MITALASGCAQVTPAEDEWARATDQQTRAQLLEMRAAYQSILELLAQSDTQTPPTQEIRAQIVRARGAIAEVRASLASMTPPTERCRQLVALLQDGLGHFDTSFGLLDRSLASEVGTIEQLELADRSDAEWVRGQRSMLTLAFRMLEVENDGLSQASRNTLEFLSTYNEAQVVYLQASALNIEYLRALSAPSPDLGEVTTRAREARDAFERYRKALAAIPEPSDGDLAAGWRHEQAGLGKIVSSYDLAVRAFTSGTEKMLMRAEHRFEDGWTDVDEAMLEMQQAVVAIAARESGGT